ncbi:MAG: PAS domain S-box protein [Acidobacteria bacterium]|nr:PAS domain S-box protein [Acidobacteriota bacterium]
MPAEQPRDSAVIDQPIYWEPSLSFLRFVIVFIVLGCSLFLLALWRYAPDQRGRALTVVGLLCVAAGAWLFQRAGYRRATVWTLGVGAWLYISVTSVFLGGVTASAIIIYPLIILAMGWLVSTRAGAVVAGASALVTLVFAMGETYGWLPAPSPTPATMRWVIQVSVFVVTAGLIAALVRSYRGRLREVQALSADLDRAQSVAHVGSWVYDLTTDRMVLSAETCRIFGLPEGTTGDRASYLSRVHPDDRDDVDRMWRQAARGQGAFDHEHRIIVGRGVAWVRQTAEFERLADGTSIRSVGTTQDITERKRTEDALRLTRIGVETAAESLFWVNPEGRIVDVNRTACEALGYTRGEMLGLGVWDLNPRTSPQRYRDHFERLRREGTITFETFHRAKDGHMVPVEILASHVRIGDDERNCVFVRDISVRKAHEAEMQAARAELECVLGSTADGILAVNRQGRVIQANARFAELWRIPPELATGADDRALIDHVAEQLTDPAGFADKVRSLYESQEELTDSVAFKDGRIFERFTAPLIQNGVMTGRVWSFRDITERMRVQGRLAMAIDVTQLVFWELDLTTGHLVFDQDMLATLGLSADPAIGSLSGWLAHLHPDDRVAFEAAMAVALLPGAPDFNVEYRMLADAGEEVWVHTRARAVQRDPSGRPLLAVGTSMNVTTRKRAEETIRRSETRSATLASMLRRMCDNVTDMIWAKDLDNQYVFANRAMCQKLLNATDTSEPVGRTDMFFAERERARHPEDPQWHTFGEMCADTDLITLERGRPSVFEESGNVRGQFLCLEVHKAPFHDEHGRVIGTVGSGRDITERKRLEETHLQAQKLESLGTLAGGIAHDFNNILAAIRGNADLAADLIGAEHAASEGLAEIRKATARASDLVRRIMVFGKPTETCHEPIDLGVVIDEVLRLLRSTLPAGIVLRTEFTSDAPLVLADAGQVHEVIVNLTTNAAHAIGSRSGEVTFRIEPVTLTDEHAAAIPGLRAGLYARLIVRDTGAGMNADMLEHIFDAFYTTKPVGEGTGLGLSVVHGIMKSHGGAVTVESVLGQGSAFTLYFRATDRIEGTPPSAPEPPRALPVGQRVLFLDDESSLVFVADRMLSRQGHHVSGFTEPQAALAAFRADPNAFDVIVTDLSMPAMSGFDLATAAHALRPDIPVVMTTGWLRAEDELKARQAGIAELVMKPVSMSDLHELIVEVTRRPM